MFHWISDSRGLNHHFSKSGRPAVWYAYSTSRNEDCSDKCVSGRTGGSRRDWRRQHTFTHFPQMMRPQQSNDRCPGPGFSSCPPYDGGDVDKGFAQVQQYASVIVWHYASVQTKLDNSIQIIIVDVFFRSLMHDVRCGESFENEWLKRASPASRQEKLVRHQAKTHGLRTTLL